jgi:hypothetical protein
MGGWESSLDGLLVTAAIKYLLGVFFFRQRVRKKGSKEVGYTA